MTDAGQEAEALVVVLTRLASTPDDALEKVNWVQIKHMQLLNKETCLDYVGSDHIKPQHPHMRCLRGALRLLLVENSPPHAKLRSFSSSFCPS